MKTTQNSLKPNSVARVDIGALLPKSVKMNAATKRNLSGARHTVAQLRKSLDKLSERLKDVESQERLDNFAIQDLMSRFNQAETLASSVSKKRDQIASSIFGNI